MAYPFESSIQLTDASCQLIFGDGDTYVQETADDVLQIYESGSLGFTLRDDQHVSIGRGGLAEERLTIDYGNLRFNVIPVSHGTLTATLAGAGAGNVDDGVHSYTVVFVDANGGETGQPSVHGDVTVTDQATDGQVQLTAIPTADAKYNIVARKIYRSKADASWALGYLLTTISDNTTTTYLDNTADASLGTESMYRKEQSNSGQVFLNSTRTMYFGDTFRTMFGYGAGSSLTTGSSLVLVGGNAGANLETGGSTVFIGYHAGYSITTGVSNIAIGYSALGTTPTAVNYNIAIGNSALAQATGSYNVILGDNAFVYGQSGNVGMGYRAGRYLSGNYNVTFGYYAGAGVASTSTGAENIFIGRNAGDSITTGSNNILIGSQVDLDAPSDGNILKIGKSTAVLLEGSMAAATEWVGTAYEFRTDEIIEYTEGTGVTIEQIVFENGYVIAPSGDGLGYRFGATADTGMVESADDRLDLFAGGSNSIRMTSSAITLYHDTSPVSTSNFDLGTTLLFWQYIYADRYYIADTATYIWVDGSSNLNFTDAVTGTKTLAELVGVDGQWTADANGITYADNVGIGVASDVTDALTIAGTLAVDEINEYTTNDGVTIEGVLLKDYDAVFSEGGTTALTIAPGTNSVDFTVAGARHLYFRPSSGYSLNIGNNYDNNTFLLIRNPDTTTTKTSALRMMAAGSTDILFRVDDDGTAYFPSIGYDDTEDYVVAIDDSTGLLTKRTVSSIGGAWDITANVITPATAGDDVRFGTSEHLEFGDATNYFVSTSNLIEVYMNSQKKAVFGDSTFWLYYDIRWYNSTGTDYNFFLWNGHDIYTQRNAVTDNHGGDFQITAGGSSSTTATHDGGNIAFYGGSQSGVTGGDGGNVYLCGGSSTNGTRGQIYLGTGSSTGSLQAKDSETNVVYYNTTTGLLTYGEPSSGSSYWTQNGTDLYYTTGNVGIGVSAPTAALHLGVSGSDTAGSGTGGIKIARATDLTSGFMIRLTATDKDLAFDYQNDSDVWGTAMYIDRSNGNVGVGTITPNQLLEISDTTGAMLRINSTKDGTWVDGDILGGIEFRGSDASGSGAGIKSYIHSVAESTYGAAFRLEFGTCDGTNPVAKRMMIGHNGTIYMYALASDDTEDHVVTVNDGDGTLTKRSVASIVAEAGSPWTEDTNGITYSSGNVGIGSASRADSELYIYRASTPGPTLTFSGWEQTFIKTGDSTGTADLTIMSGDASSGDSGDINIGTGSATGTKGSVHLRDGKYGSVSAPYDSTPTYLVSIHQATGLLSRTPISSANLWATDTNGIEYTAGNVGIGVSPSASHDLAVAGTTSFGSHIYQGDSDYHYFGSGNDARIYHSGTVFVMQSILHGAGITMQGENVSGVNKHMVNMDPDTSVDLYYAGDLKLATTSTGVEVTGELIADKVMLVEKATLDYNDQGSIMNIITLPAGAVIWDIQVEVIYSFDGDGECSLEIGISTDLDRYESGLNVKGSPGFLTETLINIPDRMTGSTIISWRFYDEAENAANGEADIYVFYTLH